MKIIFFIMAMSLNTFSLSPVTPQKANVEKVMDKEKATLPEEFKVETKKPCDIPAKEIVIEVKKPTLGSGGCKVEELENEDKSKDD